MNATCLLIESLTGIQSHILQLYWKHLFIEFRGHSWTTMVFDKESTGKL